MSFDRDAALKRAEKALRQGRIDAAIDEYQHVTTAEPRDWKTAHALGDLYVRAGQTARAMAQYARTADQLAGEGLHADALTLFQKSLKLKPDDDYAAARVREVSRKIGLGAPPGPALSGAVPVPLLDPTAIDRPDPPPFADTSVDDPDDDRSPWFIMAEIALADGRLAEGRQAVADALQFDPGAAEAALSMAYRVTAQSPDAGYQVIDVLVDRSLGDNDHAAAAAALQEFVTRAPLHLVALMRLVDVAMEGGLESTMYGAQAQLADAYLDAGRGLEARIISEDLVAREPWNRANMERFRKALALLGEADPDAVIAGRLSGESPFLATDLLDFDERDDEDEGEGLEAFDGLTLTAASMAAAEPWPRALVEQVAAPAAPAAPLAMAGQPDAATAAPATAAADRGVAAHQARPRRDASVGPDSAAPPGDDAAAASYRLGVTFGNLGLLDDAVQAFESAAASAPYRLGAAAWLGAIHRDRGHSAPAIEWFDRAARWAGPATDIGRAVRYDLASMLETVGDFDRALAVFTGLESEQVGYRDVSMRIQRLLDSEPRG